MVDAPAHNHNSDAHSPWIHIDAAARQACIGGDARHPPVDRCGARVVPSSVEDRHLKVKLTTERLRVHWEFDKHVSVDNGVGSELPLVSPRCHYLSGHGARPASVR